jgi:hypothetical protein
MSFGVNRRSFLRGTGVSLALPLLEQVAAVGLARGEPVQSPKKLVTICTSLGLYGPDFFPTTAGVDYTSTPYLDLLKDHRKDFTVLSGICHPDQSGRDGHSSEMTWLTSARNPGLGGFRNTISVDQMIAEQIGVETRYPSLQLTTSGTSCQSYTRSGVMIPAESRPSKVFAKLFLNGTPGEIAGQMQKLSEGRSIMDTVGAEVKRMERRLGVGDKEKLEEYLTAVREMETRLHKSESWVQKPKPKVDVKPMQDIQDEKDLIGRMNLMFDLIPLALQTDSTRVITMVIQARGDVPKIPGVEVDHHNLSHHGQDPAKIAQLRLVERAKLQALGGLFTRLKSKTEGNGTLLDSTAVLFGSNLGNANSHDWHNLPMLLAGGGYKHGKHIAGDAKNNTPMSNLFVTLMQNMGLEVDSFGSSTGTLTI